MAINRRQLLGSALSLPLHAAVSHAQGAPRQRRQEKILIVVSAGGGASIVDSFLPVTASSASQGIRHYSESMIEEVPGLRFLTVKSMPYKLGQPTSTSYTMRDFLSRHGRDLAVLTQTASSVNHLVGGQRSLNGNGAYQGRTLMEVVAESYGQGCLLPNVNMSQAGYVLHGSDDSLSRAAKAEVVADALLFPLGLHRDQRIEGRADAELLAEARSVRDRIDQRSHFVRQAASSRLLKEYMVLRNRIPALEAADLLESLMFFDQARLSMRSEGGTGSLLLEKVRDRFPRHASDPFEAQAALAFLLVRFGLTTAVTIGLDDLVRFQDGPTDKEVLHLPLAFDWSHNHHQGAQNTMWRRLLSPVDRLIELLKEEDYVGDPEEGKIWDRSLVYIATEFGRDRERSQGSGHHVNNGHMLLSPLLKGNQVYGGLDVQTGLTFGYDPTTGQADRQRQMTEADTFGAILRIMGISFPGQSDFRGLVRS